MSAFTIKQLPCPMSVMNLLNFSETVASKIIATRMPALPRRSDRSQGAPFHIHKDASFMKKLEGEVTALKVALPHSW
jgi:hypothetical protein